MSDAKWSRLEREMFAAMARRQVGDLDVFLGLFAGVKGLRVDQVADYPKRFKRAGLITILSKRGKRVYGVIGSMEVPA